MLRFQWEMAGNFMITGIRQMYTSGVMCDVTLACGQQSIKAHKMVLAACSPVFFRLLIHNPCKHPIVIFADIKYEDLKAVVELIYENNTLIPASRKESFTKVFKELQIPPYYLTCSHYPPPISLNPARVPTDYTEPQKQTSPRKERGDKRTLSESSSEPTSNEPINYVVKSQSKPQVSQIVRTRAPVVKPSISTERSKSLTYQTSTPFSGPLAYPSNRFMPRLPIQSHSMPSELEMLMASRMPLPDVSPVKSASHTITRSSMATAAPSSNLSMPSLALLGQLEQGKANERPIRMPGVSPAKSTPYTSSPKSSRDISVRLSNVITPGLALLDQLEQGNANMNTQMIRPSPVKSAAKRNCTMCISCPSALSGTLPMPSQDMFGHSAQIRLFTGLGESSLSKSPFKSTPVETTNYSQILSSSTQHSSFTFDPLEVQEIPFDSSGLENMRNMRKMHSDPIPSHQMIPHAGSTSSMGSSTTNIDSSSTTQSVTKSHDILSATTSVGICTTNIDFFSTTQSEMKSQDMLSAIINFDSPTTNIDSSSTTQSQDIIPSLETRSENILALLEISTEDHLPGLDIDSQDILSSLDNLPHDHILNYTDEKYYDEVFSCTACTVMTTGSANFENHVKEHRPGTIACKSWRCKICATTIVKRDDLLFHVMEQH